MKNKSILVDYLNFYTTIYIILFQYKTIYLLNKHNFLNGLYFSFLKLFKTDISYLNILYPSSNFDHYQNISNEKDFLTDQDFLTHSLLHNYLYKKYFYERIHPIVEMKVFVGDLKFDRVLINYSDFFYLLKKEGFYKKVRYYSLPLFASYHSEFAWNKVYSRRLYFIARTYFVSVLKILRFSLVIKSPHLSNVLIASKFKSSFITDSFYAFDKSHINYMVIEPDTLNIFSSQGKKISHLYAIKFSEIFKTVKGIYKVYSEFSIKSSRKMSLNLHILEQAKNIFFLKQVIHNSKVKLIYTCYEGSPIINILNLLGYESDNVISLSSMWSLGYMPEFLHELYKGCDIFFPWGEKQSMNYLKCKSPFRSLVKVGYLGDYAVKFMMNKPEENIQRLKNSGYKVVAVYDNVAFEDYLVTRSQLHNFYKGVLNLLQEESYACVIKIKYKNLLYQYVDKNLVDKILSYSGKVIFISEKSDLTPAFKSDFVYAFHQSSLGSIASIWGKKTIFYDESSFIDKNDNSTNSYIITNCDQLIPCLKALDKDSSKIDRASYIDPFVDGNAQNRIVSYINALLSSKEKSKLDIIREANSMFKKEYGNDKIIEHL